MFVLEMKLPWASSGVDIHKWEPCALLGIPFLASVNIEMFEMKFKVFVGLRVNFFLLIIDKFRGKRWLIERCQWDCLKIS